jgi:hypothetical protein
MESLLTKLKLWKTFEAHFLVKTAAQWSFHVTLRVTYNLRELHFRLNHNFQFYESDFVCMIRLTVTFQFAETINHSAQAGSQQKVLTRP